MKPVSEINELINQFNVDGRTKTFAEFLASLFKDSFIEIYLGDEFESVSVEQISTPYPAIFCGKVLGAYKECLILSSIYCEHKTLKLGKILLVNERAIRALSEVDGNGAMHEIFLRSQDTRDILEKFGKK